jgi:hypothetical protein
MSADTLDPIWGAQNRIAGFDDDKIEKVMNAGDPAAHSGGRISCYMASNIKKLFQMRLWGKISYIFRRGCIGFRRSPAESKYPFAQSRLWGKPAWQDICGLADTYLC